MERDGKGQYQRGALAPVVGRRDLITPNPKLKLLDQVREVMRLKHYSIRTETAYCDGIRRYIEFHGMHSREELQPAESTMELFLSDLAVNGKVAVSTQNQAFNALLFLYREVVHHKTGAARGRVLVNVLPDGGAHVKKVLSACELSWCRLGGWRRKPWCAGSVAVLKLADGELLMRVPESEETGDDGEEGFRSATHRRWQVGHHLAGVGDYVCRGLVDTLLPGKPGLRCRAAAGKRGKRQNAQEQD